MKIITVFCRDDQAAFVVKYHTDDNVLRDGVFPNDKMIDNEEMKVRAARAALMLMGVEGFENHRLLQRPGSSPLKTSYFVYLDDEDIAHVQSGIVTEEEIAKVFASHGA